PITIKSTLNPTVQTTIGSFQFSSSVDKSSKGTNMSRFTQHLNEYPEKGFTVDFKTLKRFTKELAERLKQENAEVEVSFPWFYERSAPQSKFAGMNHAHLTMHVSYDEKDGVR